MDKNYQGMRWLKCDLQMQTPADKKHWQGEPIVDGQEQEAANEYAEACYEAGLDVVGITEHNFLNRDFLPYLKTAFNNLQRKFGRKITLLPGFEFEAAGVGRGVHILCLFEPDTPVENLDAILTECGIRVPRIKPNGQLEKSDKNLKEILRIVQDSHGGIVIMPHATSNDGIFDSESISEWVQQDQFTNPELLAIEVPKPVHLMSRGYQRLINAGEDCQEGWRRDRPIAVVMSSDNKMLIKKDEHGKPVPNSIGYRYTWIKMSEPSIESLRQAFLDPESRIKLPENVTTDKHPAELIRHAYIKSIKIENVEFLEDQEVHFSPNKNCFIGGRGSGKSTVQEYLRIALGKDKGSNLDESTQEKINRIKGTLNDNSKLTVKWISEAGIEDEIVWTKSGVEVESKNASEVSTYLKNLSAQFFSQQQLNQLTESKPSDSGIRQAEQLLGLVDAFDAERFRELSAREKEIKANLKVAFVEQKRIQELKAHEKTLLEEHQELERQWKARSEIQDDAKKYYQLKEAEQNLKKYRDNLKKLEIDTEEILSNFFDADFNLKDEDHPYAVFLKNFAKTHEEAKIVLKSSFEAAIKSYKSKLETFFADFPEWDDLQAQIEQADHNFAQACERLGVSKEDATHLQEAALAKSKKQEEIETSKENIKKLERGSLDIKVLLRELHDLWKQQFKTRMDAAEKANELVSAENRRFMKVFVHYQQSEKSFMDLWNSDEFKPDGRSRLGRDWENFGIRLHAEFIKQSEGQPSPWALLNTWLESEDREEGLSEIFKGCETELVEHLNKKRDVWERISITRVDDVIDLKLYREDGEEAGSIGKNSLSDGQRNTAALVLLLSQGSGPLVIDQPEDELDSNFVSKELIPILRRVKPGRQLILATHHANLPVNGDAELIYAFEAQGGKGKLRACGGMDRRNVTEAILDIMEGSYEAFTSRREKYGF